MRLLVVVATAGEASVLAGLRSRVVVSGVGPVAAALATQAALLGGAVQGGALLGGAAQGSALLGGAVQGGALLEGTAQAPELVVSAGIGGAYPGSGAVLGGAAIASRMIQADLGAWDGERFLPLAALGLEVSPGQHGDFAAWAGSRALAQALGLPCGPCLTLSSVTGSLAGAAALAARYPGALTEGMEGAGVAHAAALSGVPCTEVRGVSNAVGPRDRAAWQLAPALAAMRAVLEVLEQQ